MTSSSSIVVQRQLSQPGQRPTSRVTLHQSHRLPTHLSLDSALMDSSLPPTSIGHLDIIGTNTAGNRATPPSIRVSAAPSQSPTQATDQPPSHFLMSNTSVGSGGDEVGTSLLSMRLTPIIPSKDEANEQVVSGSGSTRNNSTPPLLIISGPNTGSLDYAPSLRVKEELQRSISTPQVRRISLLISCSILISTTFRHQREIFRWKIRGPVIVLPFVLAQH